MIPTTTGYQEIVLWRGYEYVKVKNGCIGDMEAVRGPDGSLYSRWKAESWRERLRFLLTGKLWIGVMTDRQPPVTVVIGNRL